MPDNPSLRPPCSKDGCAHPVWRLLPTPAVYPPRPPKYRCRDCGTIADGSLRGSMVPPPSEVGDEEL